jgi:hypothetical protein
MKRLHVASRCLKFPVAPDKLWQIVSDFPQLPTWHPQVIRVERLPDRHGREIWRETYQGGGTSTLATLTRLPPRRLARATADLKSSVTRKVLFEFTPTEDGCRLAVTEKLEVTYRLFRLRSRPFHNPAISLDLYLKALGAKLNAEPLVQPLDNCA